MKQPATCITASITFLILFSDFWCFFHSISIYFILYRIFNRLTLSKIRRKLNICIDVKDIFVTKLWKVPIHFIFPKNFIQAQELLKMVIWIFLRTDSWMKKKTYFRPKLYIINIIVYYFWWRITNVCYATISFVGLILNKLLHMS